MRRISSRLTVFYKRLFPLIWFGLLAAFILGAAVYALPSGQPGAFPFLIVPVLMCVFGFFVMKKLVFDLVDEVFDEGNALLVRNGGREERVALSDVSNVSYVAMMNPPRVTLKLRTPTAFGTQIAFCAPFQFLPFATSPIISELIERIDRARRAGA